jgi:hypothetical protein
MGEENDEGMDAGRTWSSTHFCVACLDGWAEVRCWEGALLPYERLMQRPEQPDPELEPEPEPEPEPELGPGSVAEQPAELHGLTGDVDEVDALLAPAVVDAVLSSEVYTPPAALVTAVLRARSAAKVRTLGGGHGVLTATVAMAEVVALGCGPGCRSTTWSAHLTTSHSLAASPWGRCCRRCWRWTRWASVPTCASPSGASLCSSRW